MTNNDEDRIGWAIEAALNSATTREGRNRIEDMSRYTGYAEPGYSDPEAGIVCGNWNEVTRWNRATNNIETIDRIAVRLGNVLEHLGADLVWEDEWSECSECGKLVRVSPDRYEWTASYYEFDGSRICLECLDSEEYLQDLEENDERVNTMFDLSDHGYELVTDDFEVGFHRGQDADPKLIGKLLREGGFPDGFSISMARGSSTSDFRCGCTPTKAMKKSSKRNVSFATEKQMGRATPRAWKPLCGRRLARRLSRSAKMVRPASS